MKEVTQDFNTTPQVDTATGEISLSHEDTELGDTKDVNPIEDNNLPKTSTEEQTDCIDEDKEVENLDINAEENLQQEPQSNDDERQEIKAAYIYELFQKLNSKLDEWEHFSANLQSNVSSDQNKSITGLFNRLKDKINRNIELKMTNEELANQYKQMLSLVNDIFYNAKILYYYKNDFAKLETKVREISGSAFCYLEAELEKKDAQIEQEINIAKMENDPIIYIARNVLSLYNKCKGIIIPAKKKTAEPKDEAFYAAHKSADNTSDGYDYRPKNSNTHNSCYNSSNDYSYSNTGSPYNQSLSSSELSNPKKCKRTLKAMFSEKENYVFLISAIIGVGAILGYFVPGGLRDLVPPEKQTYIDVTIAVGASILIILCFAALIYSAYATIKISNLEFESQPVQQNDTIHR